jgi:hypothetical protein
MKLLVISVMSVFLIACGKNGELSNTKQDSTVNKEAQTMKLSKKEAIDKETTQSYEVQESKTPAPLYDTGMKPTNSK